MSNDIPAQEPSPKPVVEYELDLNDLPVQQHNWVLRGIVVSCEGAGHPSHRHFLHTKP